jgi:hypothetical protein
MKMLCIRGRTAPQHTGVFAGRVYDVDMIQHCCETRAAAQGSVWKKNTRLKCSVCNQNVFNSSGTCVPWGPDRFVPVDPTKVTIEEVNELYEPSPILEEQT